jgi:hypothetical protein
MSRWADSTDDEDEYLHDDEHEDYVDHAVEADQVRIILIVSFLLVYDTRFFPERAKNNFE